MDKVQIPDRFYVYTVNLLNFFIFRIISFLYFDFSRVFVGYGQNE